jgi:chromosome segregation ATPase
LLESLRTARDELVELDGLQREHQEVLRGVGELDAAIDDHFQRAEVEHQEVLRLSELVQEVRRDLEEKQDELSILTAEANRIHGLFRKVRERADHYHQRAMEMRKEVITIKRARRRENVEGRVLMKEQKAAVREALEDEEELDQAVDNAIATLRKGGKLEL